MRNIYKNPILYYIAVPVIVGLWPLLVWAIYLPNAQKDVEEQMEQYKLAEPTMMEILTLEPDRLEFADANETAAEFTYGEAIDRIASLCRIPPSKYNLSSAMVMTTRGQKSQSASVDLKDVDIRKFARFFSMMQLRWPNLQCERLKLSKKQNLPDNDMWDVDIELKYYY
ncbi:MAG: hypothetical protein JXA81_07800 [Sedimentisphaerales bacterium]|nr:hypothetical protein [Sedimentisphaerales bacterium]